MQSTKNKTLKEKIDKINKLINEAEYQEAFFSAESLLKKNRNNIEILTIFGWLATVLNHPERAANAYRKAVARAPQNAELYYHLGLSLRKMGLFEEALKTIRQSVDLQPSLLPAQIAIANLLQEQHRSDDARIYYNQLISNNPTESVVYYNYACLEMGQPDGAEKAKALFAKSIDLKPDFSEAYLNLAKVYENAREYQSASKVYADLKSVHPKNIEALVGLAFCAEKLNQINNAASLYRDAILIGPKQPHAYVNLGYLFRLHGKNDEAISLYESFLRQVPENGRVHQLLGEIKKYTGDEPEILHLLNLLKSGRLASGDKIAVCFALAKVFEDVGDVEKTFRHLHLANKLQHQSTRYSFSSDVEHFSQVRQAFLKLRAKTGLCRGSETAVTPIFVVGMPRSGTTLFEQVISSHPDVTAGGEIELFGKLTEDLISDFAGSTDKKIQEKLHSLWTEYSSYLEKISGGCSLVTDKLPSNFRYVGLIKLIFPSAKIVFVLRDASATCWSIYRNYFDSPGMFYSSDLGAIVKNYNLHTEYFKLWKSLVANQFVTIDYEKFTKNQNIETRQLICDLGLNWSDSCLAPHKNERIPETVSQQQVRRPVYTGSSDEWQKYKSFLGEVFVGLKSAI